MCGDYVKDLTILDLTRLNFNEIIDSVPYNYKLLMRVFLKYCGLERILTWITFPGLVYSSDYDIDEIDNEYPAHENFVKHEDAVILNLCKQKSAACKY